MKENERERSGNRDIKMKNRMERVSPMFEATLIIDLLFLKLFIHYFIFIIFLLILFSFFPTFMFFSKFSFLNLITNQSLSWIINLVIFLTFIFQGFFLRLFSFLLFTILLPSFYWILFYIILLRAIGAYSGSIPL